MTRSEEVGFAPLPAEGEVHIPEPPRDGATRGATGAPGAGHSLLNDLDALIDDARTYLHAELSYQKTRAGFIANRAKKALVLGVGAAYMAMLATIGLTVGLIIALTPLITAWGATAVVVIGLLVVAYLLVKRAASAWGEISGAMREGDPDADPQASEETHGHA